MREVRYETRAAEGRRNVLVLAPPRRRSSAWGDTCCRYNDTALPVTGVWCQGT